MVEPKLTRHPVHAHDPDRVPAPEIARGTWTWNAHVAVGCDEIAPSTATFRAYCSSWPRYHATCPAAS